MVNRLATLTQTYKPLPLIGKLFNLDTGVELRLVYFLTDSVNESCLAAIGSLRANREDVAIVVIYSGDNAHEEEVLALEAGADDFIHLPFNMPYLWGRLRATVARLRRSYRPQQPPPAIDLDPLLPTRLWWTAKRSP